MTKCLLGVKKAGTRILLNEDLRVIDYTNEVLDLYFRTRLGPSVLSRRPCS
jgi:hypothetical protein